MQVLVVGSAPDLTFPPERSFDRVIGVSRGARLAHDAGYRVTDLVTTAIMGKRGLTPNWVDNLAAWRGLHVPRLWIDETDAPMQSVLPIFAEAGLGWNNAVGYSLTERGALVRRVTGEALGVGDPMARVSSGLYAVCMALDQDPQAVVTVAGLSFDDGHHGHVRLDRRWHRDGDARALTLLASRLRTPSPALASQFGLRLAMRPENIQRLAFQQAADTATESEMCLRVAFATLGQPGTLVDIGCGDGHLVDLANSLGVAARGVDLYAPNRPHLVRHDLSTPWRGDPADMVLCWEVAEHLPPSAADTLCDTLAAVTCRQNGILLLTAATPGQGGSGHYNEQPHAYWREKLRTRRLFYHHTESQMLSKLWLEVAPRAWWYGRNIQMFKRLTSVD